MIVSLLRGGKYEAESECEYLFYIEHEERSVTTPVRFWLQWPGAQILRVLCERDEVFFRADDDSCRFEIDVNGKLGRSVTLDVHSHFREPGMTIRIEHNDPLRKAGYFRNHSWPQTQIDAAIHYIFASREVLKGLHIPSRLEEEGLGYVALMGFETNNPYHGDYPPHWHLIYRWPNFAGSQAPHIYLDENGRNTHNTVTIDGVPRVKADYEADEWCFLKDAFAKDVFAVMVCRDGGVAVAKPGSEVCRLMPFDPVRGVEIFAGPERVGAVQVRNDTAAGEMIIRWSKSDAAFPGSESYEETVNYDPVSGDIIRTVRIPI